MIDLELLKRPFQPSEIEWRVGATTKDKDKGMALAYMDARAVMERLDKVCGPENWQCRYPHATNKTCCEIGINVTPNTQTNTATGELVYMDRWVWKADGAGDTDFEGDKGAFSDAFKRAAFRWGIGRYLYSIETPWVPIEAYGNPNKPSYKITAEGLTTLTRIYRGAIWRGPLKLTEFKDAFKAFCNHLNSAPTLDDMEQLVSANGKLLEQCEYDAPDWYYGKDDIPSVDERVANIREQLKMKDAA